MSILKHNYILPLWLGTRGNSESAETSCILNLTLDENECSDRPSSCFISGEITAGIHWLGCFVEGTRSSKDENNPCRCLVSRLRLSALLYQHFRKYTA